MAGDKDELVSFQAIKRLNQIDTSKAIKIADEIIENYENEPSERINAALKVKSTEYRAARIENTLSEKKMVEKDKFISICKNIIANSDSETLKDAAIFALSGATDSLSIEEIITNPNIDEAHKSYAIAQNTLTLKDMIKDNYSEENIALLCEAAKICPNKDFTETLNSAKENLLNKNATNEELLKSIDEALEQIESAGIEYDSERWNDFYNGVA